MYRLYSLLLAMVILTTGSACDRPSGAAMEATDLSAAQAHPEMSVQRDAANESGNGLESPVDRATLANLSVALDLRLIEEDWDDFRDDLPVAFDFSWEDG